MVKKLLTTVGIILLILVAGFGTYRFSSRKAPKDLVASSVNSTDKVQKVPVAPTFDKTQFSTTDPNSLWVVVNKHRPLKPVSFTPSDLVTPKLPLRVPGNESMQLRRATATALESLFAAAKADGLNLMLSSGYRSYQYQVSLYGSYVSKSSVAEADKTSARPGFSEHQTGLAADIEPLSQKCDIDVCFASTPEGVWLAANAYTYGFMIRYTADKVPVTGYSYEPWHVRYVGTELSTELHMKKITTLEEFFGLEAAPDYSL